MTSQPTLMELAYATWQQYLTSKRYELTKIQNYMQSSKELGKQDEQQTRRFSVCEGITNAAQRTRRHLCLGQRHAPVCGGTEKQLPFRCCPPSCLQHIWRGKRCHVPPYHPLRLIRSHPTGELRHHTAKQFNAPRNSVHDDAITIPPRRRNTHH